LEQSLPENDCVCPLVQGEINAVGNACGNGWRKVFNVYAKLLFAVPRELFHFDESHASWQQFRDKALLQHNSRTSLNFTPPIFAGIGDNNNRDITIIMGRTYAKSLPLPKTLLWETPEFAIDIEHRLIVCPYFDYRQLSNSKIAFLVALIERLEQQSTDI